MVNSEFSAFIHPTYLAMFDWITTRLLASTRQWQCQGHRTGIRITVGWRRSGDGPTAFW